MTGLAELGAVDCEAEGAAEEADANALLLALMAAEDEEATDEEETVDEAIDDEAAKDEDDGPSDELVALTGPVGKVALAAGAVTVTFGSETPAVSHEDRYAVGPQRASSR